MELTYTILHDDPADADGLTFSFKFNDGKFQDVRVKLFDFDFSGLDVDGAFSFDYSYTDAGRIVSENMDEFEQILDAVVNDILQSALELASTNT